MATASPPLPFQHHPHLHLEQTINIPDSVTIYDLPQELLESVIDLAPEIIDLKSYVLVGKRWVRRCQERLFERLTLSSLETDGWTRPLSENQPLLFSYVRTLTLKAVHPLHWRDANFERCMSCFGGGRGDGQGKCRVRTLSLVDSSVDSDGEVISRVLGPLRSSVQTLRMSSVSIPPVKDVRPFFCMFSQLQNVHVPYLLTSSGVPNEESRFAKEFTLPPLNGELKLLFLYRGLEGIASSLSKLPLRFRSITVSPPCGRWNFEIDNILAVCGETVKTFRIKRAELDVQVLFPITLSPCTRLEEIRIDLQDPEDPGSGIIHLFDSITSPHLSRITLRLIAPLRSRRIDTSIFGWTGVDESLYRLAVRLRIIQESQALRANVTSSWTAPKEVKRLKLFIEARFLFVLNGNKVDLGSFLSKFREVGDVLFVTQKIRTLNEDETSRTF